MRYRLFPLFAAVLLMVGAAFAQNDDAGEGPVNSAPPTGMSVDQVIQKFAAKEADFKQARENYTYRQSVTVQGLDGYTVMGEYQEVFDVTFDEKGRRIEQVVFAPPSSIQNAGLEISSEDLDDIRNRLPFVLTAQEIPDYNIKYVGQQHVDELDTYVFDIAPKRIEKDRRYFDGRIWIDAQDLQIVMTHGRTVPQGKVGGKRENRSPAFTTYREQIDGRYWFPTYTKGDEVVHFEGDKNSARMDRRIREIIKYTDYKRFGSNTKITYDGQDVQKAPEGQQPQQQNPPK